MPKFHGSDKRFNEDLFPLFYLTGQIASKSFETRCRRAVSCGERFANAFDTHGLVICVIAYASSPIDLIPDFVAAGMLAIHLWRAVGKRRQGLEVKCRRSSSSRAGRANVSRSYRR